MVKARPLSLEEIRRTLLPVLKTGGARRAILFGSYARGEADEYSDLDLVIIAQTDKPFLERFRDFLGLWQASPLKALQVLVYTPQEFERMKQEGNPFIARVLEEGVLLYEARPEEGDSPLAPRSGE